MDVALIDSSTSEAPFPGPCECAPSVSVCGWDNIYGISRLITEWCCCARISRWWRWRRSELSKAFFSRSRGGNNDRKVLGESHERRGHFLWASSHSFTHNLEFTMPRRMKKTKKLPRHTVLSTQTLTFPPKAIVESTTSLLTSLATDFNGFFFNGIL